MTQGAEDEGEYTIQSNENEIQYLKGLGRIKKEWFEMTIRNKGAT